MPTPTEPLLEELTTRLAAWPEPLLEELTTRLAAWPVDPPTLSQVAAVLDTDPDEPQALARSLAAALADPEHPDAELLAELLLFPDAELAAALEPLLCALTDPPASAQALTALAEELAARVPEAHAALAPGLTVPLAPDQVSLTERLRELLARLRMEHQPPQALAAVLSQRLDEAAARRVLARLRRVRLAYSAPRVALLLSVAATLPPARLEDVFTVLTAVLGEADPEAELRPHLLTSLLRASALLDRAQSQAEKQASQTMEYRRSQGGPEPYIDTERERVRLGALSLVVRELYGPQVLSETLDGQIFSRTYEAEDFET